MHTCALVHLMCSWSRSHRTFATATTSTNGLKLRSFHELHRSWLNVLLESILSPQNSNSSLDLKILIISSLHPWYESNNMGFIVCKLNLSCFSLMCCFSCEIIQDYHKLLLWISTNALKYLEKLRYMKLRCCLKWVAPSPLKILLQWIYYQRWRFSHIFFCMIPN